MPAMKRKKNSIPHGEGKGMRVVSMEAMAQLTTTMLLATALQTTAPTPTTALPTTPLPAPLLLTRRPVTAMTMPWTIRQKTVSTTTIPTARILPVKPISDKAANSRPRALAHSTQGPVQMCRILLLWNITPLTRASNPMEQSTHRSSTTSAIQGQALRPMIQDSHLPTNIQISPSSRLLRHPRPSRSHAPAAIVHFTGTPNSTNTSRPTNDLSDARLIPLAPSERLSSATWTGTTAPRTRSSLGNRAATKTSRCALRAANPSLEQTIWQSIRKSTTKARRTAWVV